MFETEGGRWRGAIALLVKTVLGPGHAQQLFQLRGPQTHQIGDTHQRGVFCHLYTLIGLRQRNQEQQQRLLQLPLRPTRLQESGDCRFHLKIAGGATLE